MSEALQFLQAYCDFSDPHWVWILIGMSRNKDNPNPHHDYLQRLVVKSPEEIEECYKRIRQETNDPATAYRLYVSLNARDAAKTVYYFFSCYSVYCYEWLGVRNSPCSSSGKCIIINFPIITAAIQTAEEELDRQNGLLPNLSIGHQRTTAELDLYRDWETDRKSVV